MRLLYACLIYHLVTALDISFPEGVPQRVFRSIGHTIFAQSRSHASSESVDPTVPVDPFDDLISVDPSDFPIISSALSPADIPSTSMSAPPPIESIPIDPSIAFMGQMTVLIESRLG